MFKRFISYYRPYRHLLILDMSCVLIAGAVDLAFPQLLRFFTGDVLFRPASEIFRILLLLTLGLLAMYIIRYAAMYVVGAWGHIMGVRMESDMRRSLFQQYQKLSFSYYDRNNTGDMLSRIVNDLFDISELAHHGPETLLLASVKICGSFLLLLTLNVKMTLILLAVTVVMTLFTYIQNRKVRKIFAENRKKISEVNSRVMDALSGIRVVKSFGNENLENRKFDLRNRAFLATKEHGYMAMGFMHSGNALCQGILYLVILGGGGWFVARGALEAQELAIYALYVGIYLQPLEMLLHFTEMFQRGVSGFRRFDELMRIEPEVADSPGAQEMSSCRGLVEYRNVSFAYQPGKNVLHGINLRLDPGKTVALAGVSGGGKSTICALLPRFYDVSGGGIYIDGVNIKDITLASLRQHIGIVQQDLYMFNGTIRENIAYGKIGATDDEIIAAAKKGFHPRFYHLSAAGI